jgi:hypothetical protein
MGVEKQFKPVKLFMGFIYKELQYYQNIKERLTESFKQIDLESEIFDFDCTTYYNQEMGSPLYRRFVSFEELISPERLPEIKILTNGLEIETSIDGNRTVNIDPGYLSEANVIIATTKNYYHRVPISKGIYAHIEYVRKKKSKLSPLEWTYPDFRKPQYLEFFEKLIPLYKDAVKTGY